MTRPRLCRVCHQTASWAIEEVVPTTHIDRSGKVTRSVSVRHTFYCDEHVPD